MRSKILEWLEGYGIQLYVPDYNALYFMLIIVVILLSFLLGKEKKLPVFRFYLANVTIILTALVGGRIYALFRDSYSNVSQEPFDLLMGSGMGSSGVYLGGIGGALIILKWMKIPVWTAIDVYAPLAALALALGRVGCFLAGCCHGTVCHKPWCVTFPPTSHAYSAQLNMSLITSHAVESLPVHPTQLYEALFGFVAFVVLMLVRKNTVIDGTLFLGYMTCYGLFRFFLEFLRGDYRPMMGVLTIPQVVFGLIFLCCVLGLFYRFHSSDKR